MANSPGEAGTMNRLVRPARMPDRSPTGVIAQLPAPRADLLIFEIGGRIAKPDIEWMGARAEAAFDTIGEIDLLVLMKPWDGMDLAAAVDGELYRAQARSLRHVRRYAVVGAPLWAKAMINLGRPLTPIAERTFDDEAEARRWIDADRPAA
jgi:hypothetical protein